MKPGYKSYPAHWYYGYKQQNETEEKQETELVEE